MSDAGAKANRPLSPHLQIYRWPLTMVVSIAHRVTGVGLYLGMALLAWWLAAVAAGEAYFNFVNGIFGSRIGLVILLGFTWALVHHMLGGLRHFVWDFGYGLGKPARDRLAIANIVLSVVITILLWVVGVALR